MGASQRSAVSLCSWRSPGGSGGEPSQAYASPKAVFATRCESTGELRARRRFPLRLKRHVRDKPAIQLIVEQVEEREPIRGFEHQLAVADAPAPGAGPASRASRRRPRLLRRRRPPPRQRRLPPAQRATSRARRNLTMPDWPWITTAPPTPPRPSLGCASCSSSRSRSTSGSCVGGAAGAEIRRGNGSEVARANTGAAGLELGWRSTELVKKLGFPRRSTPTTPLANIISTASRARCLGLPRAGESQTTSIGSSTWNSNLGRRPAVTVCKSDHT